LRLWDFAVAVYGRAGAQAGWLALQDGHGQCVSFLMWRWWAAAERRPVTPALLNAAVSLARRRDAAIRALRTARRAAYGPAREAALADELTAERALLDELEALTPPAGAADAAAIGALAEAAAAWGAPLDGVGRERLARLVS
jgi:uncharacterized protein (TIGR02444 family)